MLDELEKTVPEALRRGGFQCVGVGVGVERWAGHGCRGGEDMLLKTVSGVASTCSRGS